jgi:cyclophilin family peptidyl-prolyl cis-trans isomerase
MQTEHGEIEVNLREASSHHRDEFLRYVLEGYYRNGEFFRR